LLCTVVVDGEYQHVAGFGVFGDVPAHDPVLAPVDQLIGVVGQFADAYGARVAARDAERQAAHVQLTGLCDLHQVFLADLQRPFRERVSLEEGRRQPGAHARHTVFHADHHVPALAHQFQRLHVVRGLDAWRRRNYCRRHGHGGHLRRDFQFIARRRKTEVSIEQQS